MMAGRKRKNKQPQRPARTPKPESVASAVKELMDAKAYMERQTEPLPAQAADLVKHRVRRAYCNLLEMFDGDEKRISNLLESNNRVGGGNVSGSVYVRRASDLAGKQPEPEPGWWELL